MCILLSVNSLQFKLKCWMSDSVQNWMNLTQRQPVCVIYPQCIAVQIAWWQVASIISSIGLTRCRSLTVCFLTAVERRFEHVDVCGGSWNPVDPDLVQAPPIHLLHAASHHVRNQHALLSGKINRKCSGRCANHGGSFRFKSVTLLLRPLSRRSNRFSLNTSHVKQRRGEANLSFQFQGIQINAYWDATGLAPVLVFMFTVTNLLGYCFNRHAKDDRLLNCEAGRFERVWSVLQRERHVHLTQLKGLSSPLVAQGLRLQLNKN